MSEISTQKPIRETASRTIRTLRPADTDYPPMLRDIPDPPPCLYAIGDTSLLRQRDIDAGLRQLQSLPGIGRWTANYFALRGWQAKDIFLPDDYLIKQRFPGMTPAAIARYARRWQPMRSYALLHIWYTDDWIPAAE